MAGPDGDTIRCVQHGTASQVLQRATGADGSPWRRLWDGGAIATAALVEADGSPTASTAPLAGTIGGTLPHFGGTGFVIWNGGPVHRLVEAAGEQGCAARSVWVMVGGRFVGYNAGAPPFVNAHWLSQFPTDIPAQTPLLVVCSEASIAMLPDTPSVLEEVVIGHSVQGRPIEMFCVGDGSHLVLLVGGMHTGVEENTVTLARQMVVEMERGGLSIPLVVRLCAIPVLNPDGLAHDQRTNANGVDLNRNWATSDWHPEAFHPASGTVSGGTAPLSEPETRALADFVIVARPTIVVVWHSYAALVEGNDIPLAEHLGLAYAEAAALDYVEHWEAYPITGQFIDAMEAAGVAAIDVELRWSDDSDAAAQQDGVNALLTALAYEVR
ncbi:MAG: DUF2817 domain-containing protein [Chloroflexi bacterium]|nr:DUF2817 domain-containing protein [Chloroflexota bacterium]MDA1240243.1 DUF2817 domain-containing protein [Chloroflexota bacterium]